MKFLNFLFIILLISTKSLYSQENIFFTPFNLDFEIGSQYNTPFAWIVSDNSLKLRYNAYIDDKEFYSGKKSMVLFNYDVPTKGMYGNCYQLINSLPFKNGTVEFSCQAKTNFENDSSNATFWLKEFNLYHQVINESVIQIKNSSEWNLNSFKHKFQNNTNYFQVGVLLNNLGAVWIDELRIKPVYKESKDIKIINPKFNDDILSFTKSYSKLRNFFPIKSFNWNEFLLNSINSISKEDLNKRKLFSNISESITDITPVKASSKTKSDNKYFWKHLGARSDFNYGYSSSEYKDLTTSDREREAVLMHNIDVSGDGGRRFKWSAWVKTNLESYAAQAQLWTRVTTEKGKELNLYMHKNPIKVGEWTKFEVDSILPENATRATIGCVLIGEGSAWFDDIEFSVYDDVNREKYLIANPSFESFTNDGLPKAWIFPNSVQRAGYKIEQDFNAFSKGKSSLKISSDELYRYTYPQTNEMFISDDICFPLCSPNLVDLPYDKTFIDDTTSIGRIAILIEAYSYIDQFFVGDDKTELNKVFLSLITSSINNEGVFLTDLKKLFAVLNDPQNKVWKENDTIVYSPDLQWDFFGNELIITSSNIKDIPVGSLVEGINDKSIQEIIDLNNNINSSNNKSLNNYKALEEFKIGNKNSSFTIKVNGTNIKLTRDTRIDQLFPKFRPDLSEISDSTLYINMAKVDDQTMKSILANLDEFNSLVFDARGNSLISEHFLAFFIDKDIKSNTFKLPLFTKPDQRNPDFLELKTTIKAKNQFTDKKLIFLIDERTSGYCESIIHTVKKYKLGTIIGEPSAGMPAEKAYFILPGEYRFQTSISEVLDSNGENIKHKLIQPDILVEDKPEYIEQSFDFVIEKAKIISK